MLGTGKTHFLCAKASIAIVRISYGNSVCLFVHPSGCRIPVPFQDQVR